MTLRAATNARGKRNREFEPTVVMRDRHVP